MRLYLLPTPKWAVGTLDSVINTETITHAGVHVEDAGQVEPAFAGRDIGEIGEEVAMCAGHSLRDLASPDTYADRGAIAEATAKRISARLARG
jgi:hypothetical protein